MMPLRILSAMRLFLLSFCLLFALSLSAQEQKKPSRSHRTAVGATKRNAASAPQKEKSAKKSGTKVATKTTTKTTTKPGRKTSGRNRETASNKTVVPATEGIKKLQKEQATLKQQIFESQTQLATTRKNVKSQLANLQVLNGQINKQQQIITDIQLEVDTLNNRICRHEKELKLLEADLSECKRKYSRGVLYMHRNRLTQNKLTFIFAAENFRQMYRRLRYTQEYTKYQRVQGEIIRHKEDAVREKRDLLTLARTSKKRLLQEGKMQQTQLENRKQQQQIVVNDLSKKQKQLQTTIAQQQQRYNALNNRIEQLIQAEIAAAERRRKAEEARRRAEEERRRREAERAAARTSKKQGKSSSASTEKERAKREEKTKDFKYLAPDDTDRRLSSNFASNQGRLPVPITGSYVISSHFGTYNVDGLRGVRLDNKGINLTSPGGAQARCVFDGEVTMIFTMGGFSNIIVRHGAYISVYCNLSNVSVRQGQRVRTRQLLGAVGRDAAGNCTLHFQLRHETTKLNPERWIGR